VWCACFTSIIICSVHLGSRVVALPLFSCVHAAPPSPVSRICVTPLGAGQEVGRSCVLVTVGGKTVMFDCGIHVGLKGAERFPDFKLASPSGDVTASVAAVLVTHFHLDHCGGLPVLTEHCGYRGPVLMTYPTRALCPLMLEDCRCVCACVCAGRMMVC
jgi:predicted metal-dependent RNase